MDIENLFMEIKNKRTAGGVHFSLFPRNTSMLWEIELIEKAVFLTWHSILFYRPKKLHPVTVDEVHKVIKEVDRKNAAEILKSLLYKDMAYDECLMPLHDAHRLTEQFFSLFSPDCRIYSNSNWNKNEYTNKFFEFGFRSFNSLTEATFDSGLIMIQEDKIGIIWFEDED